MPPILSLLAPLLAATPQASQPVELYAYLSEAERAVLQVQQGGEALCEIDVSHDQAHYTAPVCRFDLALTAGELVLRGRIEGRHWESGERRERSGERRWRLLDFGPVSAPLARRDGDYGERFAEYAERLEAFGRREIGEDAWYGPWIEAEEPASSAQLDAAAARLGHALPPDYVALLRRVGAPSIGDNYFTAADDLRNGYEAMIHDWGTPREDMEQLSPAGKRMLESTTLLFTEVGDGLGGLFHRPAPVEKCGGGGAFYWYHQESGDGMELVRNSAGDCADFAESVWWLLEEYVTAEVADELEAGRLLLDSNLRGQALVLSIDAFSEASFDVTLEPRWRGAHANRPFDPSQAPVLDAPAPTDSAPATPPPP